MTIKIGLPIAFSEQGKKDNQEDRIFPTIDQLATYQKCFVLCDGMGGHEKGEVAASIVSETLYNALITTVPAKNIVTKEWFEKALNRAYDALDKMAYHHEQRPGTTMTCVYMGDNGLMCAHIGDSRIYVVRPGKGIIFRTEDHSLVNQLIRAGELTEEEARNHPRRNVITRAMQPGLEKRYAADFKILQDIEAGDYIFMCCDGILERLTDEKLVEILSLDIPVEQKLKDIYDTCYGETRDNYTCILIPINEVEKDIATTVVPEAPVFEGAIKSKALANGDDTTAVINKAGNVATQHPKPPMPPKPMAKNVAPTANDKTKQCKRRSMMTTSIIAIVITLLVCLVFFLLFRSTIVGEDKKEPENQEEQTSAPSDSKTTNVPSGTSTGSQGAADDQQSNGENVSSETNNDQGQSTPPSTTTTTRPRTDNTEAEQQKKPKDPKQEAETASANHESSTGQAQVVGQAVGQVLTGGGNNTRNNGTKNEK